MFDFTLKYFGFLKNVPLLPHILDAMLKIETLFRNKNILRYIDEIENEVLSWEKTSTGLHKYGGLQFDVNEKEIGHIHSHGLLDILFSKEIKYRLLKEGKAKEHHMLKNTGWISFYICKEEDKKQAVELLRQSYKFKLEDQRPIS